VCCSCSHAEFFVFLCLIPVRSGLNCSFSSVSRFLEPSVPLLFFGQESYFRSVSPARLVFFWRFCCPRRRFSRVDSPARVQSSRPAARSSIPDRTGQERARPVLAPVPDSRTGDSALVFSISRKPHRPGPSEASRFCRSRLVLAFWVS
jgi:hypothetical protein